MMSQYMEIKSDYSEALLFYRMGDFYELFFEDAKVAANALDIALTKRGKHSGEDIPMCGVPHHSAENYIYTLINKGFRVAICEQMESPEEAKKRGYKAVVKREVVRLVTPGTLTEDNLLDAKKSNYLASYSLVHKEASVSWIDISTGSFYISSITPEKLGSELTRLSPSEILLSENLAKAHRDLAEEFGISVTELGNSAFDSSSARERLKKIFNVETVDGLGTFNRAELSSMGAIIEYLQITQKGKLPMLSRPRRELNSSFMTIDAATRKNLELTKGLSSGNKSGSLLSVIDHTLTSGGARLLEKRVSAPSTNLDEIEKRLNGLDFMIADPSLSSSLRSELRKVPDLDRALSRISLERAGPRDLVAIRNGLLQSSIISKILSSLTLPKLIKEKTAVFPEQDKFLGLLTEALVDEPPILARDGGFIREGFDPKLDEARRLRNEGKKIIAEMQMDLVKISGIQSLKIKHNNVLGYFVETPATHANRMLSPPLSDTFIHRQTTANQVRFSTVELSEIETKILNAASHSLEIEKQTFKDLCGSILQYGQCITDIADYLSEIDLTIALSELARNESWVKPAVDESQNFEISGGRHPVVEYALKKEGKAFISNECNLNDGKICLLTGPNMSGKSTFLRQNAIIVLLAQIGSFVPASSAKLGIVSQLFSRVGASDDLARGRSTFMVEMVETASILNQADENSFVILDEIGRGTATYDGLSIAWATLEHLHNVNKARALFATHYHELTHLSVEMDRLENSTVSVKEWEGDVVFLHEVIRGAADRSYGVQVAKLAGLPETVIKRSKLILEKLEKGHYQGQSNLKGLINDLPLFSNDQNFHEATEKTVDPIHEEIRNINLDNTSPRDALEFLYKLKETRKN
ncbi:DNA mismatch repair protein MutS [Paracoccaceae bacterium]|nr:DNA mismatch repair protein MutS [Paracoccaceae bacterium]